MGRLLFVMYNVSILHIFYLMINKYQSDFMTLYEFFPTFLVKYITYAALCFSILNTRVFLFRNKVIHFASYVGSARFKFITLQNVTLIVILMSTVIGRGEVNTLSLCQLQPAYLLILVYFRIHNASIHAYEVTIFKKQCAIQKHVAVFKEVHV